MNNELVFMKGKDGHYRYVSKKQARRQLIPVRIIRFFFYLMILGVILGGSYYLYTDLYEVYLVDDEILIDNGNTYQIELLPKNSKYFDYENYVYESDNTNIAIIDKYGQITAVANGSANVSVRYKYGIEKKTMKVEIRNVNVTSLTMDNTTIDKNDSKKAEVKVNDKKIGTKIDYKSSNPDVVKVDDNGNLVGIDEGESKVTIISPDGKRNEAKVEVKASNEAIQEISIKEKNVELKVGKSKKLSLSIVPSNASIKSVSWKSSDSSIVSVDSKGNIYALKAGNAKISVSTPSGLEAVSVVTVIEDSELILNTYNEEVEVGENLALSSNLQVEWTSSDNSIASIDSKGNIHAKKEGYVTITAKTRNGLTNRCRVKVNPKKVEVEKVAIKEETIDLYKGETRILSVEVTPTNATNKNLTYKSSNNSVAKVDKKGKITAVGVGKCTITVSSSNKKEDSLIVNVGIKDILPESIRFNKRTMIITEGTSAYLEPIVVPSNITNKYYEWTSSDKEVLSVDKYGRITAKKNGIVYVSVKTENNIEAKIKIFVSKKTESPKNISLNKKTLNLNIGNTYTLIASIDGNANTNQLIKWTSSDSGVAAVDQSGLVTGKKEGTTIIEARINDNIVAKCEVKVNGIAVQSIKINQSNNNLEIGKTIDLSASITPSNATNKTIRWNVGDKNIATVDSTGKVTAKKVGTTTVSAISNNGKTSTITLTVTDIIPSKIDVKEKEISLVEGTSKVITLTYTPSNATYKKFVYESQDASIAQVDTTGKVTGKKEGSTKVLVYLLSNKEVKSEVLVKVRKETIPVSLISINKPRATILVGNTIKLETIITPSNASNKTVTWKSSNPSVASVDKSGNVKGIKVGTTTITVTTYNGKKSNCIITVKLPKIVVSSIEINSNIQTVYVSESISLKATIKPDNATDKRVTWTSSDSSIAAVDQSGKVTGKKEGSVKITATSSNNKTVSKTLIVRNKPISVTKIVLNKQQLSIYTSDSYILKATISPNTATNKSLAWKSSNTKVATVDQNGNVKAVSKGNTVITATASNGKIAKCSVTVKEIKNVTGVSINKTSLKIDIGQTYQLVGTITPSDASNKSITWKSSNAKVVTVDQSGKIKGISSGNAVITVTSSNGKTANCNVTVQKSTISVKSIAITNNISKMNPNESLTFTVKVTPDNATNKEVTWKSSNSSIATVDANGKVTAKSSGSVTITAYSKENSQIYATKTFNVVVPVTKITLNTTSINTYVGYTYTLKATITPSDASNKSITWKSDNSSIASVDNKGNIKGIKPGTTTIIATISDGKTASCKVTVKSNKIQAVLKTKNGSDLNGGDPFITFDKKTGYYYYLSTSGRNITISASKNIQDVGMPEKKVTVYTSPKRHGIWAPELHFLRGKWYIYYADPIDEDGYFGRRGYVLESKTTDPLGEYVSKGRIYDPNADFYHIDGTAFEWKNELYYVYSGMPWDHATARQHLFIAHMKNPWTLDSNRVEISQAICDWEKREPGSFVNEGPEVLIKDGTLNIIYSGNGAQSEFYLLGMITYNNSGNLLTQSSWIKYPNPVFVGTSSVVSPGHASFTTSRDGKEYWIMYHASDSIDGAHKWKRTIRIKKFTWNGSVPVFGTPDPGSSYITIPSGSV